ncbi:MAG TPA: hypothetical protein VM553_22380, partial [Dongiaceae bacterium]|nr:hypothetical protein [Dongiaceae bacterium]
MRRPPLLVLYLYLFSLTFHAFIGWRLLPDLAAPDWINTGLWLASLATDTVADHSDVAQWSSLAVLVGAGLITLIGFINARRAPDVVQVDVPIANLPPSLEGFTIAQISDIHVGPTIREPWLEAIVRKVNALQADMIAVTGDLVDGRVQ